MVKAAFKAVCPLEIGDAVAMVPGDTEKYELDNDGKYRPYAVKMPVMQYAEAIKKRDDARKPQK